MDRDTGDMTESGRPDEEPVAAAVARLRESSVDSSAVVKAVLDALESRLRGVPSTTATDVAASLTDGEPDVLHTIDDLRLARDTLHRRLGHVLEPELALSVGDELNELVDEILRAATDHALRDLRADAFTDVLTDAGNRRAFERDFHRALETSKRHGRELAVVVIDLDGLKHLNDEHGHAAGDDALRALAAAFLGELRAGDGFYRIGGDEFALVLPETGAAAVDALLDRVRLTAPSFSHGWAGFPHDGETTGALLERADDRLFAGRHERRAAVAPAEPVRQRRSQALAATMPVIAALVLAELIRRVASIDLGGVLVESWVGLLLIGAILGPPVARRWCSGHRDAMATAVCAARVGVVILLVLVMALFPVHRLRKALDVAAFQRSLLERTPTASGAPHSGASTVAPPSQFALEGSPVPTAPSTPVSEALPVPTPAAPALALTDAPVAAPLPAAQVPLADIGTKSPKASFGRAPVDEGSYDTHGKGKYKVKKHVHAPKVEKAHGDPRGRARGHTAA